MMTLIANISFTDGSNMQNLTTMNFQTYNTVTRVTTLVFCFLLYISGITGNTLILWTYIKIKHLRTRQNMFVAFLSIVDLLIIGYLLPFNMYVMFVNDGIYNTFLCKFNALICHILFACSVQYIMYIALTRFCKICYGSRFNQIFTTRHILLLAISSFVIGLLFGIPILPYDNLLKFDRTLHLCIFNRYGQAVYSFLYMGVCLVLPISITTFCYVKIYCHVRKSKLMLYQHWTNPLARKRLMNELSQTRAQFAVFVAYMVLYLPFGITAMSAQFGATIDDYADEFHAIAMYTCFLNSCINSLLYGAFNRNMRKAYLQSLACFQIIRNSDNALSDSNEQSSGLITNNDNTNSIRLKENSLTIEGHSQTIQTSVL